MKLIMENWNRFLNEEITTEQDAAKWLAKQIAPLINTAKPDDYQGKLKALVDLLNSEDGQSEAVRKLLLKGGLDGIPEDERITIKTQRIAAIELSPTQGVIDLFKSVGYNGSNAESLQSVINGVSNAPPILACGQPNNYYIVDGHHRWSGAAVFNVNCLIPADVIEMPAAQALLVSQLSIAAHLGADKPLPQATAKPGRSIIGPDAMSEEQVYNLLLKTVGKVMDPRSGSTFMNPEVQAVIKASGYGGGDVRGACAQIAKNCGDLAAKFPNEGPPREIMPQFDPSKGGPEFDAVRSDLEGGKLNYKAPIKTGGGASAASSAPVTERKK